MTQAVIEWAPFKLKQDVSEEKLLEISSKLQAEFLSLQKGFIRRELVRAEPRSYVDVVWWESKALAEAAMKKAMESAVCAGYFSVMQMPEMPEPNHGVAVLEVVRSYAA